MTEMTANAFTTGNQLLRDGKLEEAIASYEKAIELNPQFAWSYQNLGDAFSVYKPSSRNRFSPRNPVSGVSRAMASQNPGENDRIMEFGQKFQVLQDS